MQTIWAYTKIVAVGAALFVVLRFVGAFSAAQSWFLTIVASLGYVLYDDLGTRIQRIQAHEAFSPFWVRVSPNWYDLLRDHGIIQSDAETFWDETDLAWQELEEHGEKSSADTYRVLRDGITFTVLTSTHYGGLVYCNNRRTFRNEIDFEERIQEIKLGSPTLRSLGWSPDVYVKWEIGGYDLGLEVNKNWREKTCLADETKRLSKVRATPDHLTGTVRLVIATLPYAEFNIYADGNAPAPPRYEAVLKKRDKELTEAGWKREEKDAELHLLGAPDCIEHKYFKIDHRAI